MMASRPRIQRDDDVFEHSYDLIGLLDNLFLAGSLGKIWGLLKIHAKYCNVSYRCHDCLMRQRARSFSISRSLNPDSTSSFRKQSKETKDDK